MLLKSLIYRRLPWVRVVEARDCGAAVFASVARYYRHHLSLEQARDLVGTDRNGTTLAGLRDGARAIGLDARPAHATYEALGQIPLPAIVHLNGREGHYAVLYRWTPASVVLLDPNRGVLQRQRDVFESLWSGYLVAFRPTPQLQPRAPDVRPAALLGRMLLQHKSALIMALVFSLLATSLGWTASFFLRTLIDNVLPQRDTALLAALGAGLVLVSAIQAVLQMARLWLSARVGRSVQHATGARFIAQLMRLPLKVFDVRCVGGLVARINQAEAIQLALTQDAVGLVSDATLFVAALAIIVVYDPVAALIALGAVPLIVIVMVALNNRVYTSQLASIVHMEEFGAQLLDTFESLRTVKTFAAETRYQEVLGSKWTSVAHARYQNRLDMALPTAWSVLATSLITACMLWYGSSRVLGGHITAGELLVLFGMVTFYLTPVQRLPATILTLRNALIGIERLEEINTLPPEHARTTEALSLPSVQGRITFDRVSFAYNRHRPVLSDVSFTIAPGETVAVVGETGSGKTSLANLIAGFYLPTQGNVLIDGVSTRQLLPDELRRSISAVFQDPKLLQQSVHDNITMLDDVPPPAVHQAARLAHAEEFIARLIYGYESQVARGGDNFSSGQAQRIALARALLKDAPILILDEATSNLDGATEQGVLHALHTSRHQRTTVIIAHRLSTVLRADRIFVMDQGAVVEQGTHDELLARRGHYYRLFRWQLHALDHDSSPELAEA